MKFNIGDRVMLKSDGSDNHRDWYKNFIGRIGEVTKKHHNEIHVQVAWGKNTMKEIWWYKKGDIMSSDIFDLKSIDSLFEELL